MPVPRRLGFVLAAAGVISAMYVASTDEVGSAGWTSAASLLAVLAVGVIDDLAGEGPRGLRNHVRALAEGRVTTGLLKALVILACAGAVVLAGPPGNAPEAIAASVLIAASSNLANSLDLRPGRTLKFFWPMLAIAWLGAPVALQPALPGVVLAALPVLLIDLSERDMLGDGGSNLIGFAAGTGLALTLPIWGLWVCAAASVGLNVLAEFTSLSRIIEGTPFLRGLDALGRRRVT